MSIKLQKFSYLVCGIGMKWLYHFVCYVYQDSTAAGKQANVTARAVGRSGFWASFGGWFWRGRVRLKSRRGFARASGVVTQPYITIVNASSHRHLQKIPDESQSTSVWSFCVRNIFSPQCWYRHWLVILPYIL